MASELLADALYSGNSSVKIMDDGRTCLTAWEPSVALLRSGTTKARTCPPRCFIYTLLYNRLGGPVEAADALANGKFRDRINLSSGLWPEIRARFTNASDNGPWAYADQAMQAEPGIDHAQARQDAVGAVMDFVERFGAQVTG